MANRQVLIMDDDPASLQVISKAFNNAQQPWIAADSPEAGWNALQNSDVRLILLRAFGKQNSGIELCRKIREQNFSNRLPVLLILRERDLGEVATALQAGASDLLVDPFGERELRMRAGLEQQRVICRFDEPTNQTTEESIVMKPPEVFLPEFDPRTKQMNFGVFEQRLSEWEHDPSTSRVAVDRIIVCPKCDGVPTLRPGCGSCGSAWIEPQILIHHYACAHVGPESEFRTPEGLVCPKCRLRNLVAGSDFEQIQGCMQCSDCKAVFTEPRLIAHCLNCQHRFPAASGRLKSIYAFKVQSQPATTVAPHSKPIAVGSVRLRAHILNRSTSESSSKVVPVDAGEDQSC